MTRSISEVHAESLRDPSEFWGRAAASVRWSRTYDRVLDDSRPPFYRWFPGGRMSTAYECLDRHVEAGHGDRLALVVESPITGTRASYTYRELTDAVARCAGALRDLGVSKGDRVVVYLPMVAEAAITMLACARIGAVHSVVFGGFAPAELAARIDDAEPVLLVTASAGLEPGRVIPYKPLVDEALRLATHVVPHCLVLQRPMAEASMVAGRDVDYATAVAAAEPAGCVEVEATDPLYILYTSGTTGQPKGVVRDHGGHLVALRWSMEHVYGVRPGEVFWAASDVGWVVGHSYIVYAPLALGCTTILYEGKPVGTPDASAFFRVVERYGVHVLFTAPTAIRAIRKEDPEGSGARAHDLRTLRALFLAGERSDPATIAWSERILGVPVVDHWWQTETGWPIAANCLGIEALPVKHGSPTVPVPGWDVRVVGEDGAELPRGETGALVVRLPMPPGALTTLHRAEARFLDAYLARFPGYYHTADAGIVDEDGYVHVLARTDDIINVAGHRLSTGRLEEVVAAHPDVAECAVVGVADALKGQVPLGFVVLKTGAAKSPEQVVVDVVAAVRAQVGAVAAFRHALCVPRLPKTRSGKTLRGTLQKIVDGVPYKVPATIDDVGILGEIEALVARDRAAGSR